MGDLPDSRNASRAARPAPSAALLLGPHEITIGPGETLVGRGPNCRIVILGPLVSRRHAKLTNDSGHVSIEDAGSANGVFVNGMRVEQRVELSDGDSVLIGTTQLTFYVGPPGAEVPKERQVFDDQGNRVTGKVDDWSASTMVRLETADVGDEDLALEDPTIQGSRPPSPRTATSGMLRKETTQARKPPIRANPPASGLPPSSGKAAAPPSSGARGANPRLGAMSAATAVPPAPQQAVGRIELATTRAGADPLETVLVVVDRMILRGDADAASRTFHGQLSKRLQAAQAGQPMPPSAVDAAAERCLTLAQMTQSGAWIDATLALYSLALQPFSPSVLEQFAALLPTVAGWDRVRLETYQELVRGMLGEVDVGALEICERILALG